MSLSKPGNLLEGQSSSDDDLLVSQSSSPDDLLASQSSSSDNLLVNQSSSPDDLLVSQSSSSDNLLVSQSSSPDDLLVSQSSSPDNLPVTLSKPDNLLEDQSSSPDDLPVSQSKADNLLEDQSSSPDDLLTSQSSSPDNLLVSQSSSPDDLLLSQWSSPDDLPVTLWKPDNLHEDQSSSPDDLPVTLSKPENLLEDQSSSPDDLLASQLSSPDDLPVSLSKPDNLLEDQSSSPDDLPVSQSSSPDDLPVSQSSSPDDLPVTLSKPDNLLEDQSSPPDDLLASQSSSPDDLLLSQWSSPDDLPVTLSKPDNLHEDQSSSPDDLLLSQWSSPDDLPVTLSKPDNLHEDQSSSPDDLPVTLSKPDNLLENQSSPPDDLLASQSSSPDGLLVSQSSSPDDLLVSQLSSLDNLPVTLSKPDNLLEDQSSSPDDLPVSLSKPDNLLEDQSSSPDDLVEEKIFDWNKYLTARNAEEVPGDFFYHVCKSELNGIEIGSVVEIENEDQSGYWFASVSSSKGVLLNLHYFGDDNDQHTFSLVIKSPRIHSLNWGSENNKKLIPPYPERFSRFKPEVIKEKVQDSEHVVSNAVLKMEGAPIYNIFKCGMFVEVQDKGYPYRVWISKVLKNVGGRLFLQMHGIDSPEDKPFWLFYLNERVFPLGWAEQKGLPWRVMNLDTSLEYSIDSSALLNVLKPKTPEQHSYKVGEMLEVLNPYSMMVFHVGTIVKIYDNRYFKVELDYDIDVNKRLSFVATKENPYLFHAGWASKHKFLLITPTDWNKPYKFSWSKYLIRKKTKFANVENSCRKKINNVHIGMKLEVVDPLNTDCIRVATVKGFADHWMFISFDRSSCCQELLHLRSVYSDEVFPVGWCNKHKYSLSVPKLPYKDSNDFEHCYYSSDVDIDFSKSDQDYLTKYPHYVKGEVFYHFSKKDKQSFDDGFEEIQDGSIKSEDEDDYDFDEIPTNSELEIKNDTDDENNHDGPILDAPALDAPVLDTPILDSSISAAKNESELDEEFHDALFVDEKVDNKPKKIDTVQKKKIIEKENPTRKNNVYHIEKSMDNVTKYPSRMFSKNSYEMCIYFNKNCYPGGHVVKKKIPDLPNCIGPGPVSKVLREAMSIFVDLDYFPRSALKKIKKIQNMLFNGPGGVEVWISTQSTKKHCSTSECLIFPESRKMARTYCSALCNLSGMCEFFMTTDDLKCPHGCNSKEPKWSSKLRSEIMPIIKKSKRLKRNERNQVATKPVSFVKRKITHSEIARIAEKVLDWKDKSLVERYKYYMGCLINFEAHIIRLNQSYTELELSLITEIQSKKHALRTLDDIDVYSNTITGVLSTYEDRFEVKENWKATFENYYRNDPRFKKFKIDIGQLEHIKVMSNPTHWSPEDVYKYLTNDLFCKDVGLKLFNEQFDGIAFMLLNEEQLLLRLRCTINLAIRIMCHVAEVKSVCLLRYCNVQPS